MLPVGGRWCLSSQQVERHLCHFAACLAPQLEIGGWSREHTRPADVLVPNWLLGMPAAFDLSVTSMLNTQIFQEACVTAGSAALAAQIRKHTVNDERCRELGWVCIPLVVETYGCWGIEASTIETCHLCFH